ncbi:primase-helicase family protein, partial [Vibrio kanaloae]|uniref:primase-helicase family protein n=1 Tax=Vibrio kanaloae TaxID=170673 RepID=UPI00355091AF
MRIQDSKHLLGSFNSHLANKLFVTIEEAFWSGSNKDAGKFRTLITDNTMTIEAKGKDAIEVDSYHRYLMCTNNDWAVPAHQQERRFFVLEVSDCKKQDNEYFRALHNDIDSPEAIGQFFNFLKRYEISTYNLHKAPMTDALQADLLQSD